MWISQNIQQIPYVQVQKKKIALDDVRKEISFILFGIEPLFLGGAACSPVSILTELSRLQSHHVLAATQRSWKMIEKKGGGREEWLEQAPSCADKASVSKEQQDPIRDTLTFPIPPLFFQISKLGSSFLRAFFNDALSTTTSNSVESYGE
jgi:hypothetical protein